MGRLLSLKDFSKEGNEDPSWWFPDASLQNGNVRFNHEPVFPFQRAVHQAIVGRLDRYTVEYRQQELRCKIRKFIERNCVGNVLRTWTGEKMDYQYIWTNPEPDKSKWDDKYRLVKIEHGYILFHFEEEVDWGLFKVAFGEHTSAVAARHPKYPDVTEEQITFAREGYRDHFKSYPDWTNR